MMRYLYYLCLVILLAVSCLADSEKTQIRIPEIPEISDNELEKKQMEYHKRCQQQWISECAVAQKMMEQGHYRDAISELEGVIKENPCNYEAYYRLALAHCAAIKEAKERGDAEYIERAVEEDFAGLICELLERALIYDRGRVWQVKGLLIDLYGYERKVWPKLIKPDCYCKHTPMLSNMTKDEKSSTYCDNLFKLDRMSERLKRLRL